MDTALELLIKNDYVVKLEQSEVGIIVTFPNNIVMDYEEIVYEYQITDDNTVIFGTGGQYKQYLISPSCARIAILCDIIAKCNARGIKRKLITAYDKEGNKVNDVLKAIHSGPPDTNKEEKLFHLVSSRHLSDETKLIAEREGMLNEYNDIVAIYNSRNGLSV